MKNFFIIKKTVEDFINVYFYKLLEDDNFKTILKHGLRKQLAPNVVSNLLIDYLKKNYITLN